MKLNLACLWLILCIAAGCATTPTAPTKDPCAAAHADYITTNAALAFCVETPGCQWGAEDVRRRIEVEAKVAAFCGTEGEPK